MNTIVYIIRHSETFKIHRGIEKTKENILFSNIKTPLSVNGEKLAEKTSLKDEFSNLDVVWSSHYVRAMSTAKYFAYKNNLKVNIDERFGERIHGCINSYDELPDNFEMKQLLDADFKMPKGESQNEVRNRMYEALEELVKENKNKKITIVTHSAATIFLLMKWCSLKLNNNIPNLVFDGKVILDKYFDYCGTFKLVFDEDINVISIENIG